MNFKLSTALGTALLAATPALAGGHGSKADVLDNYANIALAKYEDSLTTAQALQAAVNDLVANPSAEALQAAKTAWLASR
ncbi:MAG: imelysin family protein, partial [Pseudomonadota bacterium]